MNNQVFIDYDEKNVILCKNNSVITKVYCFNQEDTEMCFFVLKHIVETKDEIFVDAMDIKMINSKKTVRVASVMATGEDCIAKAYQKLFLNFDITKNVCILLLVDNDVPLNGINQDIFDDETVLDKEATIFWKVSCSEKSGKTAKLIAIIFS